MAIKILEERLPRLREYQIEDDDFNVWLNSLSEVENLEGLELEPEEISNEEDPEDVSLYSETHIDQFYEALKFREKALDKLEGEEISEIGGFTRDFLIDYLRPTTIVDGQHRTLGALKELESIVDGKERREEYHNFIKEGNDPEKALELMKEKYVRHFGVSLIFDDSWEEHVFQFVVVNQKATPIPKALLATIISTTLSEQEIEKIQQRLSNANIKVEDYLVLNDINTSDDSPFQGLIKRGYGGQENTRNLDMSVADRIISIFRYLKNSRPFRDKRGNDYAKFVLADLETIFPITLEYEDHGYESPLEYWQAPKGLWRIIFIQTYAKIREIFSDTNNDPNAFNKWFSPKESNLFNGVSLEIFAQDFFEFLSNRRPKIKKVGDIEQVILDWLENPLKNQNPSQYFARDWNLTGLRKTDTVVKSTWSLIWHKFRTDPRGHLPSYTEFRPKS